MGGGNEQRSGDELPVRGIRSGAIAESFQGKSASSLAFNVFNTLAGGWTLERQIDDARLGLGSFRGTALFSPCQDGLLFEERGELRLGAWNGPAWRRWIYSLEGDAIAVRYPDTLAELHVFRFAHEASGEALARHTHICGDDQYEAQFRTRLDGSLSSTHVVTGPAKNYRLSTLLTRT